MKKIILIGVMTGLTASSTSACYCLFRWGKIYQQFDQKEFPVLKVNDLPLSTEKVEQSQHSIFVVSGKQNSKIQLVSRYKETRAGCLFITCLSEQDEGYAVNLGWAPIAQVQETLQKLESAKEQEQQMKCMVRVAEHKPPIHALDGDQEAYIDYIDLESISKKYNLQNPLAKKFYLDKIGEEQSQSLQDEQDHDIYPVPNYLSSFEMPYLTPEKHQAYYVFWGSCTCLGLLTIIRLIKI